jgi:hypothetical protein
MSTLILTLGVAIKSFFVFFGIPKDSNSEPFEEWLNDDGFTQETLNNPLKKYLITELDGLKMKFRQDLRDSNLTKDEYGNPITPLKTTAIIVSAMIQIDKLRLVIQHELSIVKNLHKPSGVRYIVARSYWIDEKGKKFRKFAKNIGSEDKVMENGKITSWKLDQVEKEIDQMMIDQYRLEYQ